MDKDITITEIINKHLDAQYKRAFGKQLLQIRYLSTNSGSDMVKSLNLLDEEAQGLTESGQPISTDNKKLKTALNAFGAVLAVTGSLIGRNAQAVQDSGIQVAPQSVTARVFMNLTDKMISGGLDPLSAKALARYESAIQNAGGQFRIPSARFLSTYKACDFVHSAEWIAKMEGWGSGYANKTREIFKNGLANGWSPEYTAQKLREVATNIPYSAAENLTRTLQLNSYRQASLEMEKINGNFITGKIRIATLDERTCIACVALHGTPVPLGEAVEDHYRGRAEMAGNLIETSSPTAFKTIRYNGDIFIIRTASGKFLPVTAYHPVLTRRGWIAAKFVKVGDDVISDSGREGTSLGMNPNEKHIPTRVEDIPRAFGMSRLGSVPESAEDFYRKTVDGDVDIVYINRLLWDGLNPILQERLRQDVLGHRASIPVHLSGLSSFAKRITTNWFSSNGINRRLNSSLTLGFAHSDKSQRNSLGHGSWLDAILQKNFFYNLSGNSKLFSDSVFGFPTVVASTNSSFIGNRKDNFVPTVIGQFPSLNLETFGFTPEQPLSREVILEGLLRSVSNAGGDNDIVPAQITFDPVVEVGVRGFSGHVYSLQSKEGWYYSNGIISHNCTEFYQVPGGDEFPSTMQSDSAPGNRNFVPFKTGEEWFASLPPERQAQQAAFLNSPAKLAAYNDGVPLSAFVGEHTDPVFGNQFVELSLKDAVSNPEDYYMKNQIPESPIYGFTEDENFALNDYSQSGYKSINSDMRNDVILHEDNQFIVDRINDAFDKVPGITEDATVYRGGNFTQGFIDNLQPGAVFKDNAFVSTSLSEEIARVTSIKGNDKPVIMEILLPSGTKVIDPSQGGQYAYELERLLRSGSEFTVIENNQGEIFTTIKLELRR